MNHLVNKLESILFVASKPLSLKQLAQYTGASPEETTQALTELAELKTNTGIVLLDTNSSYQLATNSEYSQAVQDFLSADLKESLTEATSEVLAIVAYRQPISKAEIEAIRGVNSQYSLRALLMRGLIEKTKNPNDARGPAYQVTTDFLQQIGITSMKELPNFEDITSKIKLPETPATREEQREQSAASENNSVPEDPTEELFETE